MFRHKRTIPLPLPRIIFIDNNINSIRLKVHSWSIGGGGAVANGTARPLNGRQSSDGGMSRVLVPDRRGGMKCFTCEAYDEAPSIDRADFVLRLNLQLISFMMGSCKLKLRCSGARPFVKALQQGSKRSVILTIYTVTGKDTRYRVSLGLLTVGYKAAAGGRVDKLRDNCRMLGGVPVFGSEYQLWGYSQINSLAINH